MLISFGALANINIKLNKSESIKTAAQILGDSKYQAICYGGYRSVTREVQPSIAQIKEDLNIMSAMNIKILRTYNTKLDEIRNLLKAITELKAENPSFEMYVMLGVWIDCENAWTKLPPNHDKENLQANTEEINRAVELANAYPDIIKIISVGNEAMVHWATSYYVKPNVILKWVNYLQKLKAKNKLSPSIWITSSDNYASWGGADSSYHVDDLKKLYNAVDYVSIHTYPMHDTHYNPVFWGLKSTDKNLLKSEKIDSLMFRSINYAKAQYRSVQSYMKSLGVNKPIHIGETGWASSDNELYGKLGSSACDEYKSAKYYQLMREWTDKENITCFYFEAFDERWKDAENIEGSENHFGLFTIDGKAKYALWKAVDQGLFNGLKRDGNPIVKTFNGKEEYLLNIVELPKNMTMEVYETSEKGNALTLLTAFEPTAQSLVVSINPEEKFQKIEGFGGSFTEASAYLLNKLSKENRNKILQAYFGEDGARYSMTRTHMASCDFSLSNYTYAKKEGDKELKHFSIEDDKADLIPMILDAKKISKEGFKIISSPWTAPPWMKDNKSYVGGKLLPEYNKAFALYFSKYLTAYENEGIDIWGVTVINEPHGNGNNWESTLFSPKEMTDFVQNYLGPQLEKDGWSSLNVLGYDQNRAGLKEWVDEMYRDKLSSKYFAGTAIHWYESTYDYFPEDLQYAHKKAPHKLLIETEGCVDSEIPKWNDDAWYWKKEATDWGWDWASEKDKHLHPKYAPVNRYATDIIGCLNNYVNGWIDWNMVLDTQGGPNWFKNWCVAPVIVDPNKDEVYFTPLYYVMAHFSKFMRPGALKIGCTINHNEVMATAVQNTDGSIVIALFNPTEEKYSIKINVNKEVKNITIDAKALQTIILN